MQLNSLNIFLHFFYRQIDKESCMACNWMGQEGQLEQASMWEDQQTSGGPCQSNSKLWGYIQCVGKNGCRWKGQWPLRFHKSNGARQKTTA